ncbi:hypothetical protein KCH_61220 [Kitasatospora cheerisanensis KCTC 2395]|uniref:Uncharacterized protein n=2 Tax=Kitasatospora cheerisanensis TaxID=81942 RepID=A0A066YVJ1_9ACTN|nr:hypothetical protein KCH_61220 [Kitasatospora cheerisanensis KCTC 2395]
MVRELQYAKEYMEQNPAGKHDDIANSEGIKQAAAVYHQYVGQVGNDVDGMLRKSANHIADMTGMGQSCALNGAGGAGGSGGAGGAGIGTMSGSGSPFGMPAGLREPGAAGDAPAARPTAWAAPVRPARSACRTPPAARARTSAGRIPRRRKPVRRRRIPGRRGPVRRVGRLRQLGWHPRAGTLQAAHPQHAELRPGRIGQRRTGVHAAQLRRGPAEHRRPG